MATFSKFINSFSEDSNKKGEQFEYFVKWFLENDFYWKSKVKKVWPFNDFPKACGNDIGTDLIFEDHDGRYWGVQAKNYAESNQVKKDDISSFLSDTSKKIIYKRLLIITTNKINSNALKTINQSEKDIIVFKRDNFDDRGDIYPSSLSDLVNHNLKDFIKKPNPKVHQLKAINDVVKKFNYSKKGQLIMACGTGKTFTCFWIHKELKSKKTLVLVPSLNLMSQVLQEWIKANGAPFSSLCVCSDPSTVKNIQEDEIIIEKSDLPYSVTSDVDEIKGFLEKTEPTVVFSTYQSSPLIAEAQAKVKSHYFELAIADEAHRCAGKVSSNFATILDDRKIRSNKKLFTTATPKIYSEATRRSLEVKDLEFVDMDNIDHFGKVFHYFPFSKAIEKKLLANYKVVVVGIDNFSIKEMIDRREVVSFDDKLTDAKSLAIQIGFIKALKKYNLKKVITFHGRVNKSRHFSKIIKDTFSWIKQKYKPNTILFTDYVKGKMPTNERRKKIKLLEESKENQTAILSNARCLGEGVDVPTLDGISFIDPKSSKIDIIQCVGRAIRKPNKEKEFGYIILPIFINDKGSTIETIENSDFKFIWNILNALKSHDDQLKFELDQIRINLGKKGITGKSSKIFFDLPVKLDKSFQNEINTLLISKITDSWNFYFGLLQKYYDKFKTTRIADTEYDNYKLGGWVKSQRQNYKKKILSSSKINKLENNFDDWSWNPHDDDWNLNFGMLLKYYQEFNTSSIFKTKIYKGFNIERWVVKQRQNYRNNLLEKYRIKKLEKSFSDWSWNKRDERWEKQIESLKKYYKKYNTSNVEKEKSPKTYKFINKLRTRYKKNNIPEDRVKEIEKNFKDWTWDPHQDSWDETFNLLKKYFLEFKTSKVTISKTYKGVNIGNWVRINRTMYNQKKLSKERIKKFEENFSDWTWDPFESIWIEKFNLLKKYYKKFNHSRLSAKEFFEGSNLGGWVTHQRSIFNKNKLSKERITKLEKNFHDWSWDAIEDDWEYKFNILKEYYQKFGKTTGEKNKSFKGVNLKNWIGKQRTSFKKNELSEEKIEKLERKFEDWAWDPFEEKWIKNFVLLKNFYEDFNTSIMPAKKKYKGVYLGRWIDKQRQKYKNKKLSDEKVKRLQETFADWKWKIGRW